MDSVTYSNSLVRKILNRLWVWKKKVLRISFVNRRLSFFTDGQDFWWRQIREYFPLVSYLVTKLGRFAQKRERRTQLMCGNASDPDEWLRPCKRGVLSGVWQSTQPFNNNSHTFNLSMFAFISTEGALRRPMTYDSQSHPVHLIHPTYSPEWTKQA